MFPGSFWFPSLRLSLLLACVLPPLKITRRLCSMWWMPWTRASSTLRPVKSTTPWRLNFGLQLIVTSIFQTVKFTGKYNWHSFHSAHMNIVESVALPSSGHICSCFCLFQLSLLFFILCCSFLFAVCFLLAATASPSSYCRFYLPAEWRHCHYLLLIYWLHLLIQFSASLKICPFVEGGLSRHIAYRLDLCHWFIHSLWRARCPMAIVFSFPFFSLCSIISFHLPIY